MSDYFRQSSEDATYFYDTTLSVDDSSDASDTVNEDAESLAPRHSYNAPGGGLSHGLSLYLNNSAATTLAERLSMQGMLSATEPTIIDGILDLRSSLPHNVERSSRIQAPPLRPSPSSGSESTATPSVFSRGDSSRRDSSSTTGTSAEQSISLGGNVPSHGQPFIGVLDVAGDEVRENRPVLCPLKDILQSPCDEDSIGPGFEPFRRHVMSHFDSVDPPPKVLCVFCNASFKDNRNPRACWREYLEHLWASHLRNGRDIVEMRPDFVTLKYFLDKAMITRERYDLICELANERNFSWLRSKTWEPGEREAKAYRDAKRDADVFVESPTRRRARDGDVPSRHPVRATRGHAS